MTTFGDQVFQHGGVPVNGLLRTGNTYFVNPNSNSGGNGKKPSTPFTTMDAAVAKLTSLKGDVIYIIPEDAGFPPAATRQTATLTIDESAVSIVGLTPSVMLGQRAIISQLSTSTGIAPLMNVTGHANYFANLEIFSGAADATALGALQVTGNRNHFYRCQISGCGNATQDAAGQYSLKVTGSENLFEDCFIGLDTIDRDGTNGWAELVIGPGPRNIFKNCIFATYASGAGHHFVQTVQSLDRFTLFDNCLFYNAEQMSTVTALTEAFDMVATTEHCVILKNCMLVGGADWDAATSDRISINMPAPAANGDGGYAEHVD